MFPTRKRIFLLHQSGNVIRNRMPTCAVLQWASGDGLRRFSCGINWTYWSVNRCRG
jgi:hypothetical protein